MITVVGLGVEEGDLTKKGKNAILNGGKVVVRTALARSVQNVQALGVEFTSLDSVYSSARSFTTLNKKLAQAVLEFAKQGDVVYCVDGNVTEDRSVAILCRNRMGQKVKLVGGVSKAQRALELSGVENCFATVLSAYDLFEVKTPCFPLVIYDLDDRFLAGDVKMTLSDWVGEECEITLLQGEKKKKIPVYLLDRQKEYNYATAVVVPEVPLLQKQRFTVADLKSIIERLRRPDGCPWDKVQTPKTIRMNLVEEAYELVDAIDLEDPDKIREETGDVLLQAVFHAVMQEEEGNFNLTDAVSELCQKLIFRHSHIFGKDKATDEASALSVWEKNKAIEKGQDTFSKAVNDVPKCFPACMRAQKVQKRAAKSGFDFSSATAAAEKKKEELAEWQSAVDNGDKENTQEELGDLLFAVINVGRLSGVDCELALKESVDKFARRFTETERLVIADGKDITKLNEEQLNEYYLKAKANLKK